MSSNFYQYQSMPCRSIGPEYFCEESQLTHGIKEQDCLFSMLQLSNGNTTCQQVPVHVTTQIVEQINEAYYIAIIPTPLKVQIKCGKMDFTTLHGNYLITLPPSCSFKTLDYEYINRKESMEGHPLLLPEIKISKIEINTTNVKLNIKDVPLDQLHTLQRDQNQINFINPANISYSPGIWSIPIYIILAILITAFIGYKILWRRKNKKSFPRDNKPEEEIEPKVLFVPNKTSS